MFKAVLLQAGVSLIAALVAAVFLGTRGALSTGLGGLVCVLPNALFALRLHTLRNRQATSYPVVFLAGEIIKLAATVGLMALVWLNYKDVHWLAFFFGFILALKANLFAFLLKT